MNRSVPCLHRVHVGEPVGALSVHSALGMSIEFRSVVERLDHLDRQAQRDGCGRRSQLVTFDDGWADAMALASHFETWAYLQPVLFLTLRQLEGDQGLLPLPRLYEWCASTGNSLASLERDGISRSGLKLMPEADQHRALDGIGVPRILISREVLALDQIADLMAQGWLVGSHGHDHTDLRRFDSDELGAGLNAALKSVSKLGGVTWLAWPEGRCCNRTCDVAAAVGFSLQFSLAVETKSLQRPDLIRREIFK